MIYFCYFDFFLLVLIFVGISLPLVLRNGLSKLGAPEEVIEFLSNWFGGDEDYPKIPEAKGSIKAIRSEAFFIPLYELYLAYGGIFRLSFGPKVCSFC